MEDSGGTTHPHFSKAKTSKDHLIRRSILVRQVLEANGFLR